MELHRDSITKAFVIDGEVVALGEDVITKQQVTKNGKSYTVVTTLEVPALPGEEMVEISPKLAERINDPEDELTIDSLSIENGQITENKELADKLKAETVPETAQGTDLPESVQL